MSSFLFAWVVVIHTQRRPLNQFGMNSKLQKNYPSGSVGYDHLLKLLVIGDSGKNLKGD